MFVHSFKRKCCVLISFMVVLLTAGQLVDTWSIHDYDEKLGLQHDRSEENRERAAHEIKTEHISGNYVRERSMDDSRLQVNDYVMDTDNQLGGGDQNNDIQMVRNRGFFDRFQDDESEEVRRLKAQKKNMEKRLKEQKKLDKKTKKHQKKERELQEKLAKIRNKQQRDQQKLEFNSNNNNNFNNNNDEDDNGNDRGFGGNREPNSQGNRFGGGGGGDYESAYGDDGGSNNLNRNQRPMDRSGDGPQIGHNEHQNSDLFPSWVSYAVPIVASITVLTLFGVFYVYTEWNHTGNYYSFSGLENDEQQQGSLVLTSVSTVTEPHNLVVSTNSSH